MNQLKIITISTILIVGACFAAKGFAQTEESDFNFGFEEQMIVRNPFVSKLPEIPKPVLPPISGGVDQPSKPEVKVIPGDDYNPPPEPPDEEEIDIAEPPQVEILGLVWNTDRPQAIVNGFVVEVGDLINDFKIVNIRKEGIELDYYGKSFLMKPDMNPRETESSQTAPVDY